MLLLTVIPVAAQFDVFGNSIPVREKKQNLPQSPNITDSNGLKQGEWSKTYDNGNYRYKATFKDNKPVGEMIRYHENGKKSAVINYNTDGKGMAKLFDEAENLIAEGVYLGTIRDSTWRFYDEKKTLKSTENYVNGLIDGVVTVFYPNGSVSEEVAYRKGVKHGPWKQYFRGGGVQLEAEYRDGKLHGVYKTFNGSGVCDVLGRYSEGKEDGDWKIFDAEKKEYYILKYDKGKLVNASEIDKRMEKKLAEYERNRRMLKDPEQYRNDSEGYMNR